MGRPAKATPDQIARACAKLETAGDLTVHTLRQELGGGGSDMLMRNLRAWRQRRLEEARVPLANMVSAGLQEAWFEELQRVRNDAARDVHAIYAEDKAHLNFCMSEVQHLEEEVARLEALVLKGTTALQQSHAEATSKAEGQRQEIEKHKRGCEVLTLRLTDYQHMDREKTAELALARQRAEQDTRELAREKAAHSELLQMYQNGLVAQTSLSSDLARLEERCSQQQETMQYMRTDVASKTRDLESLRKANTTLEASLRSTGEAAARAEASLSERKRSSRRYVFAASDDSAAASSTRAKGQ